jgi:hypothetical protein
MTRSLHDENYLYYSQHWHLEAVIIVHVDDLLICATSAFMDWAVRKIESRFGKLKCNVMPFVYLGVRHQMLSPVHIMLDQQEYLSKLVPINVNPARLKKDSLSLERQEHFDFRSLLCSMLWLCLTRLDVLADVTTLQQEMVSPLMCHVRQLNALLKRAKRDENLNGLHFRYVPFPLRVCGISDSSYTTKTTVYAQEAKLVVLMTDRTRVSDCTEWNEGSDAQRHAGYGHPLYFKAGKAQRVSHSTSHSESLAAVGTTQMAQLIAMRYGEPFVQTFLGRPPKPLDYIWGAMTTMMPMLPVDHVTDCMDLFELCTGIRGLANDKNQRIIIMSLREDRMRGFIRCFSHWPTGIMLADGLTKVGHFPQLLRFCTTGCVVLELPTDKFIRCRTRVRVTDYSERDVEHIEQ